MSVSFYVCMEKVTAEIALDHVDKMEDILSDSDVPEYMDNKKVINNLKHGFIVSTMAIAFVESFLNSILRDCVKLREDDPLLKKDFDTKINSICDNYAAHFGEIKAIESYKSFSRLRKVRNYLMHYKTNWISEGLAIDDFKIGNEGFKAYFTKSSLEKELNNVFNLCNVIAVKLKLSINSEAQVINCDARDGLTGYVFDSENIILDPSRKIEKENV